jgi:hypothetical protein
MNESELVARSKEITQLYIESGKIYAQLSVGALALTIAFKTQYPRSGLSVRRSLLLYRDVGRLGAVQLVVHVDGNRLAIF